MSYAYIFNAPVYWFLVRVNQQESAKGLATIPKFNHTMEILAGRLRVGRRGVCGNVAVAQVNNQRFAARWVTRSKHFRPQKWPDLPRVNIAPVCDGGDASLVEHEGTIIVWVAKTSTGPCGLQGARG
jgi:hypothetical protein